MRVAILVDFLRPNGAGIMALEQGRLLHGAGHAVSFVAAAASDEVVAAVGGIGTAVDAFVHTEAPFDQPMGSTESATLRRAAASWMLGRIEELDPDVVCIHNCGRVLDQHTIADLSRTRPVVFVAHDEWFFTDAHYRMIDVDASQRTFEPHRSSDLGQHGYEHLDEVERRAGNLTVIAPSAWLHRRCLARFPGLRCIHLRNPVDPRLFDAVDRSVARRELGLDDDAQVVVAVGNPSQRRKGLVRLARAMSLIPTSPPLLIAVGGTSNQTGRRARRALLPGRLADLVGPESNEPTGFHGYDSDTIVVGDAPRQLMPLFYGAADLVVHPSIIDNLPTVPIEAGLTGTRCIATDVGGTEESIAELDGLFPADLLDGELAARISAELAAVRRETPAVRAARRTQVLERFDPAAHLRLLEPLLASMVVRP